MKETMRLGPVSRFEEIANMLSITYGIVNDPVQPNTLKLTFPPQFINPNATFPVKEKAIFQVEKIELEKRKHIINPGTYKIRHCLQYVSRDFGFDLNGSIPSFVCGFIDHVNKELQRWRAVC